MKKITSIFIIYLFINGVFGDEVKSVSVMEGNSVTLHTDITNIPAGDDVTVIWKYQKDKIAQFNNLIANKISIYNDVLDGRFRDRLRVDIQTGDLTITNIRTTDSGLYKVEIGVESKKTQKSFDVKGVVDAGDVKSVSVMEGDSVTLHTDVSANVIKWRFGPQETLIAGLNKADNKISIYDDVLDGRFRDRLKVNNQTGDLTITNIRMDQTQVYKLDLGSSSYTIHQSFTVTVSGEVKPVSVMEGDSVTLYTDVPDIKTYDQIEWMFGDKNTQIAEINNEDSRVATFDVLDGKFSDRLKMNSQTGSLTINDVKTDDSGQYAVKMSSRRRSIHRTLTVDVSEQQGLSSGAVVGICVFFILLIAAVVVAGVIYHNHKITEMGNEEELRVHEGISVDLKTEVTDIQRVEKIEWRFGETLIAKIKPAKNIFSTYDGDDDLFRDKLKLNRQTGDLTISDSSEEHSGVYKLKIIRDGKTSHKTFNVSVIGNILERDEGESVHLKTKVTDIKRVEKIEWRFKENCGIECIQMVKYKGALIAEINPANNIFRTYDGDDDLFRDKLKLNDQTGDLTINDIREGHAGFYIRKITRDGKTSERRFIVIVRCTKEELLVYEGKSVDLKTEVKDIQRDDVIEWRFGETLIAEINLANNIFSTYDDDKGLFRGKLKLNHQTGDLTINDIREKLPGVYRLKIIRDEKTLYKRFSVFVRGETKILEGDEGKSVDLKTEVTDIKKGDLIKWGFGDKETLIAEINPANNIFSTYDGDDNLFRDKLRLNHKTGDLNINDFGEKHVGVYTLRIIKDGETSYKRFRVSVKAGGHSVGIEMDPLLNKRIQ